MKIFGTYQTAKNLKKTPIIDFLEFSFPAGHPLLKPFLQNKPGTFDEISVWLDADWDSSQWNYDPQTGKGEFQCNGIYLNERSASGSLDLFNRSEVKGMQVYSQELANRPDNVFYLTKLTISDDNGYIRTLPFRAFKDAWVVMETC